MTKVPLVYHVEYELPSRQESGHLDVYRDQPVASLLDVCELYDYVRAAVGRGIEITRYNLLPLTDGQLEVFVNV